MISLQDQQVLARRNGLVEKQVGDEVVIYDIATDHAHLLNPAATEVWRRCEQTITVSALVEQLKTVLDTNGTTEEITWAALADLQHAGLLEHEITFPADRLVTRRGLLKKAGLAALALPTITTILAPPAAATHTQAGCTPGGGTCTPGTHMDCCTNFTCENVNGAGTNRCCNKTLGANCNATAGDFCCTGTCGTNISGNTSCCRTSGAACQANADCCSPVAGQGMVCDVRLTSPVCAQCVGSGTASAAASVCCTGYTSTVKVSGSDVTSCCTGPGATASSASNCCSGVYSVNPTTCACAPSTSTNGNPRTVSDAAVCCSGARRAGTGNTTCCNPRGTSITQTSGRDLCCNATDSQATSCA